jgi:spore coat polysaccharide biosynthesis protein SpsF
MLSTLGIVQARLGSTRLAGKVARKLGGKPLVEWVVRRATECQRLDRVIVATGDGPGDRAIADLVPPDVAVFPGSESDVLGRFVAALRQFPARGVVRMCADNPFIDPVLIDRLVRTADEHPDCDYLSYCTQSGRPVILSPIGVFAEWCRADALAEAARLTSDPIDREHVTRFLYSHPERFNVRLVPAPVELDREDLRLTVDIEDDWEHAQAIFEALGPESLDWQQITGLLDGQPAVRRKMAWLNRKHAKV